MADEPIPTLDYAPPPRTLPPPNDEIGLPRREWLNQRARRAALVTIALPFTLVLLAAVHPLGRAAMGAVGVAMVLLAILDIVLAVGALRALNYAGRVGPTLALCLIAMLAAAVAVLLGVVSILIAMPNF